MVAAVRQEPNAAWNKAAEASADGGTPEAVNERIRKLEWEAQCAKRAYDRQYALHKEQVEVDAKLREEVRDLEMVTEKLEARRSRQLGEQHKMAAEELKAWRAKFDEQKATGQMWISTGRTQLTEILNTLEMERIAVAERRRVAEAKLAELECSTVPPSLKEDVDRLKELSSTLEAEVPAKKVKAKQMRACVEQMTARLSRKKRLLKHVLAHVKKMKAQEKLAGRSASTPKETWVGPTPPFYIDRGQPGEPNQGLVYGQVTIADGESGEPHTEKVLKRPGVVPILYYCDGMPLMSAGGGTPPIKPYLLHTIREESGAADGGGAAESPRTACEDAVEKDGAELKENIQLESLPCPSTGGAVRSPSTPRCTISSEARVAATAKRMQSLKTGDAGEPSKARPDAKDSVPKRSKRTGSGGKVFWTDYRAWRQENECKPYLQEQKKLKEAQPMPQFKTPLRERHSNKHPTVPVAPKLKADERARTRKYPTQEANAVYTKLKKQYIARARNNGPKVRA
eukprot:evm.model.scf_2079.2 EVM.evm.TU.scf_2079.2   scf_2079:19655-24308(+)